MRNFETIPEAFAFMKLKIKSDKTKSNTANHLIWFVSLFQVYHQIYSQWNKSGESWDPQMSQIQVGINPFMHKIIKWPNILKKSCGFTAQDF